MHVSVLVYLAVRYRVRDTTYQDGRVDQTGARSKDRKKMVTESRKKVT